MEFGNNLGLILAPWLKSFEADVLIIGGNISHASNLFLPALVTTLYKNKIQVEVKISTLKEKATFMGCSRLGNPKFYNIASHNLYDTVTC